MFKKIRNRKNKSQDASQQQQHGIPYRSPSTPAPIPPSPYSRRSSDATTTVQPEDDIRNVERQITQVSEVSKFEIVPPGLSTGSSKQRQKSQDRRADPQGLTVLYSPVDSRSADIVFVHGLGGSSRQTWSKNRDLDLFWPQNWLPKEAEISSARIMTFGYNAHFSTSGPNSVYSLADFAKALLYDMRFGKDNDGRDLAMGDVPIVFVVHSLGGLVFKKAYIAGQSDTQYQNLVKEIRAVLFMSTPHRGSNLAIILNRILATSFMGHTSKQYIADLKKNSPVIEALNEDFRNLAPKLQIFCFYETLETTVAFKSFMVLEKDSSILGYPGEISRPLDADHHTVCKFASPEDPNYKSVRSALLTLIRNYNISGLQKSKSKLTVDLQNVKALLSVSGPPEDDLRESRNRWQPGTCDSILYAPTFVDWTQDSTSSSILWAYARPGSGKSVLSSYLIHHLKQSGCICAYYFFKYLDASKRSLSSMLRSIAFQVAEDLPEFYQALTNLLEDTTQFEKLDIRSIWQRLYRSTLFKLNYAQPMYWVIDALDESESVNTIVETLSGIQDSQSPIKILITSRELPTITAAFGRISSVPIVRMCLDDNTKDIRHYTASQVRYMHGTIDFKQEITAQIVDLAQGNFLWAELAIKQVLQRHNPEDIQAALSELPPGMDALYRRMEMNIKQLSRAADKETSRTILTWATFARRPLTKDDLLSVLKTENLVPLDLNHTISELCGHFVIADSNDRITLVHQTAREYLVKSQDMPFSLDLESSQESLFMTCLSPFLDHKLRSKLRQKAFPSFLEYAATSWSHHLESCSAASNEILDILVKFLNGSYILTWIQTLAMLGQLRDLVFASRSLATFAQKRRKVDAPTMPLLHRDSDLSLLELWAVDLLKIVGKFGDHLLQDPTVIYKYIPQFCPRDSMIRQTTSGSSQFSVVGLEATEWDDCLARLSVGSNQQAFTLTTHGRYLAVSTSGASIILWDSLTLETIHTFLHNEHIFKMCFSSGGRKLATYGLQTTRIWDVSTGRQTYIVNNPMDARPLALSFVENDTALLAATDTRDVSKLYINNNTESWKSLDDRIMQEDTSIPDTFLNSPTSLAFSPERTELAVAYRGYPLTIWSLEDAYLINRCKRRLGFQKVSTSSWTGVNRICWHPTSGDVLGIYTDGMVFRWHPIEENHQELQSTDINATPSEIECSPDGIVFATSDVNGAIKLYNFRHFTLVYQLSSEDIVTALCFAPDGKRFYDLRGSYCYVWEPNALIRLSGLEDTTTDNKSDYGSTVASVIASEVFAESPVLITAIAASSKTGLLFAGDEEGEVRILDMTCQPQQEIGKSATEMGVDHLVCTGDGRYLAYTDLGGRLVVRAVEKLSNSKYTWGSRLVMNVKLNLQIGGIRQLIFSPDGALILVASLDSAQLWSLKLKSVQAVFMSRKPGTSQRWILYPARPDQLAAISPTNITIYDWKDLACIDSYELDVLAHQQSTESALTRPDSRQPQSPQAEESSNISVIVSQTSDMILLSTSRSTPFSNQQTQYFLLETTQIMTPSSSPIVPIPLHPGVTAILAVPLAILGKDNLVFLDLSFWVCTWRLGATSGKAQRHFFLPRDWVNTEILGLCQVLDDGTLLCPRKGEIAVIKSTLGSGW
ncbi:hypothetical protein MMC27_004599 [Xylographa pallens]|nr:hypothetical protein [Xylographa pallens]